ncbi:MAG: hypothetical protein EBZ77_14845, partial [Chitinophagia bacterium]|nr:hypothetical protein [Chitinophagia bacterium]
NIKYTVGVVAGGQLMLPPAAQAPWVGDDSLASYGDGFKPLLSAVGVRALSDSTFSAVDITKITTVKNGLVVAAIPDTFRQLSISKASCVEGDYVIWLAVAKNNVADSPLATTLFYNKLTMPVSSTSLPSLVKEPITDNYVAGGIVLETQIAPGNIRFLVKGLLMKTTAGWVVQPVTEKKVTLAGQDELEALPKPGSTVEADAPAIQPNKKSKKQKK